MDKINPTPNPSLKGGEQKVKEFFGAKGAKKLQKKVFPALEGGGRGWVKAAFSPLSRGDWRRFLPILVLIALTAAVSAPVYSHRILTPTENDYGTHVLFTQRMLKRELPPTFVLAHPLLQVIIGFIYWAGRGHIGLWETAVLVQVLAQIATSLGLYAWIGALRGQWGEAKRVFFSLSLTLVGPVMLLAPLDGRFYFGYIGLANYHNPTVHLLRPFALASFYFAVRVFREPKNPASMVWLSAGLMVAGSLVKPNYAMSILPALGLITAWYLWKKRPLDGRMLVWGQVVPAVLMLAMQTVLIYLVPDADKSGITIAPFQVESGYSGYLGLKFLLSILFPLALGVIYLSLTPSPEGNLSLTPSPKGEGSAPLPFRGRVGGEVFLALAAFLLGVLQLYLLAETGERFFHGNFRWSAQITLFILFAAGVRYLLRRDEQLVSWQRWLVYGAYALHLAGGIAYYIYVFISPHYS